MRIEETEKLYRRLKLLGKDPVIMCAREIKSENIDNYIEFDAFINTACPRIAIDGRRSFRKPILNYNEANSLLVLMEEEIEEKKLRDAIRDCSNASKS